MYFEFHKLKYPEKVRERFLSETKSYLIKLIQSKIYPDKLKILVDESGKRIYITYNEEYEKDKNIISKIKEYYPYNNNILDKIFENNTNLRLVNFLNIPPLQLELKLLSYFELIRRQLFFWAVHHLFEFKIRKFCIQKLGVGFDNPDTVLFAHSIYIDRMSPSLVFIEGNAVVGARTILQTHGIKSNRGYGSSYAIGPIYIMEGADIGSDCIILPGTIIGKGCAVYPMTVVKKDICPVYDKDRFYSVTYNQNEEYPYRLNISLTEAKSFGMHYPLYFKSLKDKIILAN